MPRNTESPRDTWYLPWLAHSGVFSHPPLPAALCIPGLPSSMGEGANSAPLSLLQGTSWPDSVAGGSQGSKAVSFFFAFLSIGKWEPWTGLFSSTVGRSSKRKGPGECSEPAGARQLSHACSCRTPRATYSRRMMPSHLLREKPTKLCLA